MMKTILIAIMFLTVSAMGQQKLAQIREQNLLQDRHRVWGGKTNDLLPLIRESAKSMEFVQKDGWYLVRGKVEKVGEPLTIRAYDRPNGEDNPPDTHTATLKNYPHKAKVGEIIYCFARRLEVGTYDFGTPKN